MIESFYAKKLHAERRTGALILIKILIKIENYRKIPENLYAALLQIIEIMEEI